MALPRISRSARMAELSADKTRVVERPRTIIPGRVDKLIQVRALRLQEKAQISIEGEAGYRKLRIENSLTGEDGEPVRLKKGAEVDVTLEADREGVNRKNR